jgi:hypothetical protein
MVRLAGKPHQVLATLGQPGTRIEIELGGSSVQLLTRITDSVSDKFLRLWAGRR